MYENLERIASFRVDHTKLKPGIYVSRRDIAKTPVITTFDLRFKCPNTEPIEQAAIHTIEHLGATFLRNSPIKDYVTPNHVIGTDFEVKIKGHETESSNMNFKYNDGDELVLTGGFIQKNLNANKTIYIEREIGQRPVLAFGNSGSDTSMMNYAIDERNAYKAQAYMVVADDNVREWGTQDWASKSADYKDKGYIPVSMKSNFAKIYSDGITKAEQQYHI